MRKYAILLEIGYVGRTSQGGPLRNRTIVNECGDIDPLFGQSQVTNDGNGIVNTAARRSETAFLPEGDPVCECLASRMKSLLRNIQHEHVEPLQLVRYANHGDQYRLHTDWSETPRSIIDQEYNVMRQSRRPGSIFLYLEDSYEGGEAFFPYVASISPTADNEKYTISDNSEGLLIRTRRGSGVFWNNLHANGSGDFRVTHSGLPVLSGKKVGLNIWSSYVFDLPFLGP